MKTQCDSKRILVDSNRLSWQIVSSVTSQSFELRQLSVPDVGSWSRCVRPELLPLPRPWIAQLRARL